MSRAAVDDILHRIQQLPEEERQLLGELLAEEEEREWREEAAQAREMAHQRGIDQAAIDHAVHAVRHGE